ncbi:neuroblast differentiation-associated protein AHNAK-like [Acipenser ruthenus]|uniref:neuroblast differentiation-associated protein AHNAK-like n=1 Tax=Acipenser ruthenus TaxID=7906 RepID=UPI0027417A51|nr:neuroblast differentiation-associated protein AHNAK-like [Acipenser ruthenus]
MTDEVLSRIASIPGKVYDSTGFAKIFRCDRESEESHIFIKDRESVVGEVKDTEQAAHSERPASTIHPLHHPGTREEPESQERVAQKEKLHAELKQVLNLKRSLQKQTSHPSLRSMDVPVEGSLTQKEEVKLSKLVEVVVETEPEAGATGFSVSGGGNKGIFVKDVLKDSPAAKALSLREGDQLLSARVYFENVKYEDALKILQCAENYKVSYLLKRTVPGANISVSPSKGSLDIKGPKAKMPKLSVKSITPMKKKKKKGKASVKLSGGTSLPAGAEFNVGGTPAKLELSPVDVEFAFPKFSKLKKTGKAATGGDMGLEAQPGAAIPWRKKRRIKFPRMRVKDAAMAQVDVSGETPGGSIAVTPSKGKLEMDVPEAKLKTKGKSPKFGIFFPKTKKAKVDVSLPKVDVDIKTPEAKFKPPRVELDISIPTGKADITVPKPELEGKEEVKFKSPKLELDFGLPSGKAEVPEVEIKGPAKDEIRLPKVRLDISLPAGKADVPKPEVSVKGPKVDIKGGIEAPDGKVKGEGFKIKMPKFGISSQTSDLEGPAVEWDLDVESPEGKLKMPKVKLPKIGISLPSDEFEGCVSAPRGEVDIEGPDGKHKGRLKMPSISIAAPNVDIDFSLPKGKAEMEADWKMPAAEGTVEAGMKSPGGSGATDYAEAKVSVPKADVKGPKAEVKVGKMEVELPDVKFKGPKMKMPSFGISSPKMKGEGSLPETEVLNESAEGKMKLPKIPSIDISLPVPDLDLNLPLGKGTGPGAEIKGDVDTRSRGSRERLDMKLKKPKIYFPKFGLSGKEKESGADIHISTPKVDVKEPKIDIQGIEIEGPSAKGAKINMPKIDLSLPKIKSPEAELDIHGMDIEGSRSKGGKITMPEIDLSLPKMKPPKVELDVHGIEVEGPSAKGAKISMPKIDLSLPKMKSPEAELDIHGMDIEGSGSKGGKITMPEIDLSLPKMKSPKVELDVHGIEVEGPSAKGAKISMPKIDLSLPKMKSPEAELDIHGMDIEGSRSKGGKITMPEIDLSLPKMKPPKVELDVHGIEVEGPSAKGAKISMPKIDLSLPKMKSPEAELDIHGMDIEGSGSKGGKITMPKIDLSLPKMKSPKVEFDVHGIEVEGPSAKGAKISMPKIDLSLPKMKSPEAELDSHGMDIEGSAAKGGKITMPKIDLSLPKMKSPKIELDVHAIEVEGPSAKGAKISMPKIDLSLPKMKSPDAELDIHGMDIEGSGSKGGKITMPNIDLSLPKMKSPEAELDVQGMDIEGSGFKGGKITVPKMDLSLPKIKFPEGDVSVPEGKIKVKGTKVEGDETDARLNMSSVKMPAIDIDMPKIDLDLGFLKTDAHVEGGGKVPEHPGAGGNFEGPDIHLKMPKISLPKFGIKGSEGDADVDLDLKGQVKPPKAEIKGTDIGDPKVKGPGITMSTFGITFGKGKEAEIDIKAPKGKRDISSPELETGIKPPKVKAALKGPGLEAEGIDAKLKLPTVKMPSFDISVPKLPDVNFDIKMPKGKAEASVEGDISGQSLSAKGPDIEIKMPKLPTFSKGKGEVEIEAPEIDVEGPDGKLTGPKLKKPTFGISFPKGKSGEACLEGELDVSRPTLKAPEVKVKAPKGKLEVTRPDVDIDMKGGKVKLPTVKLPSVDISSPKVDIDFGLPKAKGNDKEQIGLFKAEGDRPSSGASFDVPDVSLKMPKFSLPKFGGKAKAGAVDLEVPKAEVKVTPPKINVEGRAPSVESDVDGKAKGKEGKMKMPRIKMPSFGISKKEGEITVCCPEIDTRVKKGKVEIEAPEVELEGPEGKVKTQNKFAKFKMSSPKGKVPEAEAKVDTRFSGKGGFEAPDVTLKMPKMSMPKFGSKSANIDLGTPDADLEGKGKIKMPALEISLPAVKQPEVGLLPKAEVDVSEADIKGYEGDLKIPKMPTIDFSAPKIELDISFSKANMGASVDSDAGIKADIDKGFEGSDFKLKMPKISLPTFGISGSKEQDIELDMRGAKSDISNQAEIKTPELHISTPKATIDTPDYEIEDGDGKLKMPKIKMPKVDISLPKGKTGEADMSLTEGKVRIEEPDFDGDGESKFKLPSFGLPKFSSPTVKAPELDLEFNLGKPKHETEITGPHIKGPKIEGMGPHGDTEGEFKMKGPKIKMPKVEISGPVLKGADVEIDAGLPKAEKEKGKIEIKPPKIEGSIDISSKEIKGPKVKGTEFKIGMPKRKVEVDAGLEADMKKTDIDEEGAGGRFKIKMPKFGMSKGKVEAPELETSVDIEGGDSSFKMPQISLPDVGFSSSKGGDADAGVDISLPKAELDLKKDIKVEGPKAEGKIKVDAPEGHLKMPKFKMPSIGISVSKDQGEGEAEFTAKGNLEGKTKKHHFKMPGVEISATKVKADGQDGELGLVLPEDKEEIKLKMPKISMPSVGFSDSKDKEASVESITPEDDSKGEGFKIKMPKFGISSKTYDHEGPAVEADLDVEGPEGKLKMPKVKLPKIGISCPSGEFEGGTDVSAPRGEVDIEGPEGKRKGGLKMPSINIAAPKVDLDFSLSKGKDEADLKMPEPEGTAEASMKGPGVEIKMPKVTFPKFGGSGVTGDAESLPKGVGVGGKTKVDVKDQKVDIKAPKVEIKAPKVEIKAPEVEVGGPELDTDKKSKVKIPKFGIELPKLTEPQAEIDVSAPDAKVKVKGPEIKGKDSEVPSKSGETDGKYEGPKMPKVKKAVFVFVKPKTNGSSTSLSESEGSVGSAEAKIRMPKIKMKPTFGKSQSTTKGVKVKGEADGDEGEGKGEWKTKSGKIKLPKVNFSPGKTGSFDVTLNGSGGKKSEGSGPHVNGESEPTFQNGSQEDKAKFGKLKLPKIEFSSPYTKGAEGDAEMSMKPGKTEEPSGDDGEGKGMKFKSPKITFPGFKKKGKGEEEKPGTLVSSTARTEMALLESGDKITTESSAKPKVSIDFVSGRSKGEYTVESSASATCSESGGVPTLRGVQGVDEQKTEGKEKSPKFRLPKFSLSPRSKGILEISSEGSPQGSRDSLQQTRGAESSGGFKIQMPRLGFKTSQEVHTTEEQTVTVEEGGVVVGSKTLKHTATASMTERSTTI